MWISRVPNLRRSCLLCRIALRAMVFLGAAEAGAGGMHGAVLPTASLRLSSLEGFGVQGGIIVGMQGKCGTDCMAPDMWGFYASAEAATGTPSYHTGFTFGGWPMARLSFGAACHDSAGWSVAGPLRCGPEVELQYLLVLGRFGAYPVEEALSWGLGIGF